MVFAICDKNVKRCEYIHDMLNYYSYDRKLNVRVYSFFDPIVLFNKIEDGGDFDYVVIEGDTVTFREYRRLIEKRTETVFISMVDSPKCDYEGNVYYIENKSKESLYGIGRVIDRTLKIHHYSEAMGCYIVQKSNMLSRIRFVDILYIEHIKNDNIIHLTNGKTVTERKTITDIIEEIDKDFFVRCHRSYLVNIMYVQDIKCSHISMTNGITIPISRTVSSVIKKQYLNFYTSKVNGMNVIIQESKKSFC